MLTRPALLAAALLAHALTSSCAGAPPPAAAPPPPAAAAATPPPPTASPAPELLLGSWLGTLVTPGASLRIAVRFETAPGGALQARLTSVDQGGQQIPASSVAVDGQQVRLEVASLQARFEGKLGKGANGPTLVGAWTQGGGTLPLTFEKGARAQEPRRPQLPRRPYPYREEEVAYDSSASGVRLAATLTVPPGRGPFPAVVLITGSGPQDRDESLFGHRPFLVLADHLARQGIASLRADDRGVARSTGSFATATTADFVDDALAGVAFLRGRPEIDVRRIGLAGHSEGGLVAPLAAVRSRQIAFIVMLAAPGLVGEQILYLQGWRRAERLGAPAQIVARERSVQERLYAALKGEPDNTRVAVQLRAAWATAGRPMTPQQEKRNLQLLTSPWFRYFLTLDPAPILKKVRCPVLVLNGEKDTQVTPAENLPAISAAFRAGGNRQVTLRELAGLNHLFQTATTGAVTEYGTIEETFAPVALQAISDWIRERKRR